MVGYYIYTQSGRSLDFGNPTADQVSLEDVARGLYHETRFANQNLLKTTVLQHTMFMHKLAKATVATRIERLAVLLHDAAEAYTRDIPSNLKKLCPQIAEVESRVLRAVIERVLLDAEAPRLCIAGLVEEVLTAISGQGIKDLDTYSGRLEAAISFVSLPPWVGEITAQDKHYMRMWPTEDCMLDDYVTEVRRAAYAVVEGIHAKTQ